MGLEQKELMESARIWEHEIKKLNIGVARDYISLFKTEMPESETVGRLSLSINTFYLNPTGTGKRNMINIAGELVDEIEARPL